MQIKSIIPSFLTVCNLICGFLVLMLDPYYGAWLILLGGIFDVMDGAAARVLNAQSALGKELDSLADIVSFGVAPAFLLQTLIPAPYHFICILPVITAALRLARFNVQKNQAYYFSGLAVPASALFYIGMYFAMGEVDLANSNMLYVFIGSILVISILNVSTIKMFSFKGIKKDQLSRLFLLICAMVGIFVNFWNPSYSLLLVMACYIVLSLVYHFSMSNPIKTEKS